MVMLVGCGAPRAQEEIQPHLFLALLEGVFFYLLIFILGDYNALFLLNKFSASLVVSPGVALEYAVKIAESTNSHPWFCIPHLAEDDYVQNLAEFLYLSFSFLSLLINLLLGL